MEINKIYNINCLELLKKIQNELIDLIITSPPYDDIREYDGYNFNFEKIADQLYRVLKKGKVLVWIVGDATKNGSESLTSFNQVLYFNKIGFKLHDTMIYYKESQPRQNSYRYEQFFEYMFILGKGKQQKRDLLKDPCKGAGKRINRKCRDSGGDLLIRSSNITNKHKTRGNVWKYKVGGKEDQFAHEHPAIFPEKLAEDHILSWSNEGDLIADPFMGSGTTAKMAIKNNRNYIGSEISKKYCQLIEKRINRAKYDYNNNLF